MSSKAGWDRQCRCGRRASLGDCHWKWIYVYVGDKDTPISSICVQNNPKPYLCADCAVNVLENVKIMTPRDARHFLLDFYRKQRKINPDVVLPIILIPNLKASELALEESFVRQTYLAEGWEECGKQNQEHLRQSHAMSNQIIQLNHNIVHLESNFVDRLVDNITNGVKDNLLKYIWKKIRGKKEN